jgi:hypothetical protein
MNDFVSLNIEDNSFFNFRWNYDFSEFFDVQKRFLDFSNFLDGAFISKHKFYGME